LKKEKDMTTYTDLYRQRSDLKRQMTKLKYKREKWNEYVILSEAVKALTKELKRLAAIKNF
jgi:hypothetical protein